MTRGQRIENYQPSQPKQKRPEHKLFEYGKNIPVRTCREGDIVLVPKIGTLRIDFEGQEYDIAQDREVLAVIKEVESESEPESKS